MNMQRRSDFDSGFTRVCFGQRPTPEQEEEIDRARKERAIRIQHIDSASRHHPEFTKMASWFCLSVRDRSEFSVEKELQRADIVACVPRRLGERKLHRHRMIDAPILPVIPGYMLVRCVPTVSAFIGLRRIDKVTGIIGKGEIPYRVPDRFIEPFIRLAAEGKYDFHPEEHGYETGMAVRVTDGPFASFPGIVTSIDLAVKEGRINVEVSIFGRLTPVELDLNQVEKWDCGKAKSVGVIRSRKLR
jgi:transcriptional antiterminator NusG